jgi:hypothetical protein
VTRRVDPPYRLGVTWFTSVQAAAYVGCPTVEAFRLWARRHGVPCAHRGRRLLFHPRDLDAAVGASDVRREA